MSAIHIDNKEAQRASTKGTHHDHDSTIQQGLCPSNGATVHQNRHGLESYNRVCNRGDGDLGLRQKTPAKQNAGA
jgi:hypothetical protein